MLRLRIAVLTIVALSCGAAAYGQCDGWVQWTIAEGGNDHWYRLTTIGTWVEAEAEAVGYGGHLVTIDNSDENTWVFDTFAVNNVWIGLFQDIGDATYSEPSEGWKWISDPSLCRWLTGNPDICYTNWESGEPNNNLGTEHWSQLKGSGSTFATSWNDSTGLATHLGGVIERETEPSCVPAVSTWGLCILGLLLLVTATATMRRKPVAGS